MDEQLNQLDTTLTRMARLAGGLRADPDGDVSRAVADLRAAFATRGPVEPAVARVRESLTTLRIVNHAGSRREFQRRAPGLDHLIDVVEHALLPDLRRIGFDV